MSVRLAVGLVLSVLFLLSVAAAARGAGEDMPKANPEWRAAYAAVRGLHEELKAEVDAMKRIRAAQEEVMAWNEERARLGLPTVTLRPALCLEEENRRWCRLFPATFGVGEGGR